MLKKLNSKVKVKVKLVEKQGQITRNLVKINIKTVISEMNLPETCLA